MIKLIFAIECIVYCLLMGLICFLGTGSDEKNIKSYHNYPDELKNLLRDDPKYKDKIKEEKPIALFISNLIIFLIITFIFGIFIRTDNFVNNFLGLFILGQIVNLFDLLIMDMLWFRHTKRVRFTEYSDERLYKDPKEHLVSFLKALFMFTIVALIDGALLMLF